eukprot:gnl/TRDRNA2_/TRDRNA2_183591_c0_seq1.p1 gnl/TRDRNA2_/TRDRNA2_183591_c0~~gnl/TRDRNA2_/TRDRNA2_183591_c0_seq1.p1  ORF type:complete len:315 (-),score=84.11 gnl/TRDRNA2_/TRDRNA2_183591_c0_seq1:199-1104(-)
MAGRMGRSTSAVGMMEGAFFVSRTELLSWVNDLLDINLTKVELCASGAVYCQILDAGKPGVVAMKKVNWTAKADHEFIPNFKVLQAAFDKLRIDKHIEVDKLIRAKYQDNLEFLQWMKCYYDREGCKSPDYDPVAARQDRPVLPWAKGSGLAPRPRAPPVEKENQQPLRESRDDVKKAIRPSPASPPTGAPKARAARPESANAQGGQEKELRGKVADLERDNEELRDTVDGLEAERDYYFKKLREVEILCSAVLASKEPESVQPTEDVVRQIQAILYAEEGDEDGPDTERKLELDGSPVAA